jgi:ribosome-binding ATPase YchF (GTP1/OBG family)
MKAEGLPNVGKSTLFNFMPKPKRQFPFAPSNRCGKMIPVEEKRWCQSALATEIL